MAVSSMTGFARVEGQVDGFAWVWELKSVNGKALDLRFRLPSGYDALEAPCKSLLGDRIKRGSINVSLSITEAARASQLVINEAALGQIIGLLKSLEGVIDAAPPRLDGLLGMRGVMELVDDQPGPEVREARLAALGASFSQAVDALVAARDGEGERIGRVLLARLDEIGTLVATAEAAAATQPDAIRARFKQQIADLLDGAAPPVPEERLAQELAIILARADVREELDRLTAHIQAASDLLAEGAGVGRRFDFLCQEFNREANTVCSKSADLGLTRVGLDLKAAIEQLREQVQNIE